jgi:hypothetical protein
MQVLILQDYGEFGVPVALAGFHGMTLTRSLFVAPFALF